MSSFFGKYRAKLSAFARLSFLSLLVIIAFIAFLPNYEKLPEMISMSDVMNHFMAFLVLAFFLDLGYRLKIQIAFILLLAYGLFIESVQYFLPNRHFDLLDVIVDLSGVLFYYLGEKMFIFKY